MQMPSGDFFERGRFSQQFNQSINATGASPTIGRDQNFESAHKQDFKDFRDSRSEADNAIRVYGETLAQNALDANTPQGTALANQIMNIMDRKMDGMGSSGVPGVKAAGSQTVPQMQSKLQDLQGLQFAHPELTGDIVGMDIANKYTNAEAAISSFSREAMRLDGMRIIDQTMEGLKTKPEPSAMPKVIVP